MYKNILVAYDSSDGSKMALERGIELSHHSQALITALWVKAPLPQYAETVSEIEEERNAADEYFQQLQTETARFSSSGDVQIRMAMKTGNSAKCILSFAEEIHCDLIVIGHKGHSGMWGRFLGHTADRVSENAHCSVLIVR